MGNGQKNKHPQGKRISNAQRYMREVLRQHTVALFKLADTAESMKHHGLAPVDFLRDNGLPEEMLTTILEMPRLPKGQRRLLEEKGVSLLALQPFCAANTTVRERAIRSLETHGKLAGEDITNIEMDERAKETTRGEISRYLQRELKSQTDFSCTLLERGARFLVELIEDFDSLDAPEQAVRRPKIVKRAAQLLTRLDEVFRDAEKPVEDWLNVGLTDPFAQNVAEARHALAMLADGRFSDKLPVIDPKSFWTISRYVRQYLPAWSALESIRFLAGGLAPRDQRTRRDLRPVEKLTAIDISAGIGGNVIGLESAGFFFNAVFDRDGAAAKTLRNNLTAPISIRCSIDTRRRFIAKLDQLSRSSRGKKKQLDLVVGSFIARKRRDPGKCEDPTKLLLAAKEVIEAIRPRAFLFEVLPEAEDDPQFLPSFAAEYQALGYQLTVFRPIFKDYGIPQKADKKNGRLFLIGIERKLRRQVVLPVVHHPLTRTLSEIVDHSAFPYRTRVSKLRVKGMGATLVSQAQKQYDQWAAKLLEGAYEFGEFERSSLASYNDVPDTIAHLHEYRRPQMPYESELGRRGPGRPKKYISGKPELDLKSWVQTEWSKRGFDVTDRRLDVPKVGERLPDRLPLTPQIVRALRGMPSYWRLDGELHAQIELSCEASPPVIALAIGRSLHAALSGEVIDLGSKNALVLDQRWSRGPIQAPRLELAEHPRAWIASLWAQGAASLKMPPAISKKVIYDPSDTGLTSAEFEEMTKLPCYSRIIRAKAPANFEKVKNWAKLRPRIPQIHRP